MEFHVSRSARGRHGFEGALFSPRGTAVFDSVESARRLAEKINAGRDLPRHPERAVKAGQLHAMGLIEEILRHVIELYREARGAAVSRKVLSWLDATVGRERVDAAQRKFFEEFPPPV